MESQNHLRDAVDKRDISEDTRVRLDQWAEAALGEVTGLMEYLQSPEALRNARRAREHRIASRQERLNKRNLEQRNPEQPNSEQPNPEQPNPEQPNLEQSNLEPPNPERRTWNRT
jgi:hypothetical protein